MKQKMTLKDAYLITGASNKSDLSRKLNITRQAVSKWPEDDIPDSGKCKIYEYQFAQQSNGFEIDDDKAA